MKTNPLEIRLAELTAEWEKGQARYQELDQQRQSVQQQLLRIDGAIQVLRELLDAEQHAIKTTKLASA